jgi:hypothetical protein
MFHSAEKIKKAICDSESKRDKGNSKSLKIRRITNITGYSSNTTISQQISY